METKDVGARVPRRRDSARLRPDLGVLMSVFTLEQADPVQRAARRRRSQCRFVVGALIFWVLTAAFWYFADTPKDFVSDTEHFKYGTIGSDTTSGIPYEIWRVLPDLFPNYLPDPKAFEALPTDERSPRAAYAQFGFVQEAGHDVPIGFSVRHLTVDRVGLNCAVCHVSTLRVSDGMDPNKIYGHEPTYTSAARDRVIILGMPAATTDLGAYIRFLHDCGTDPVFDAPHVIAAIEKSRGRGLGPVDRLIYRDAVRQVAETIKRQRDAFVFLREKPRSGPGRIDTFNPYKTYVFNFPYDGTVGTSDFPSIWNQRPREGLHLHWDGNNTSVFERNISASLGAGATPVSLDLARMMRVASWIGSPNPSIPMTEEQIKDARDDPRPRPDELQIPRYPFAINALLANQGAAVYARACAKCHDWHGEYLGQIEPINRIGTDPARLDSYTEELAANQNTLGAGRAWRFNHFRKTNGYANAPLDGVWARAPYLHNGSVPDLTALLTPAERPDHFYRGSDTYDPERMGFVSKDSSDGFGRKLIPFDTTLEGNHNKGHTYGSDLTKEEKKALLEFLKTQ
jgi:hypothetical protein